MTKADKIRSMTDEQLAEFIESIIDCWYCPAYQECTEVKSCDSALLSWLKMEHKERGEDEINN